MKLKQIICDIILIVVISTLVIGAYIWHEHDKAEHRQMMYHYGYQDGCNQWELSIKR